MNGSSGPSGMIDQTTKARFSQKSLTVKLINPRRWVVRENVTHIRLGSGQC